jgi:hypothetical protein
MRNTKSCRWPAWSRRRHEPPMPSILFILRDKKTLRCRVLAARVTMRWRKADATRRIGHADFSHCVKDARRQHSPRLRRQLPATRQTSTFALPGHVHAQARFVVERCEVREEVGLGPRGGWHRLGPRQRQTTHHTHLLALSTNKHAAPRASNGSLPGRSTKQHPCRPLFYRRVDHGSAALCQCEQGVGWVASNTRHASCTLMALFLPYMSLAGPASGSVSFSFLTSCSSNVLPLAFPCVNNVCN